MLPGVKERLEFASALNKQGRQRMLANLATPVTMNLGIEGRVFGQEVGRLVIPLMAHARNIVGGLPATSGHWPAG